MLEGRRVNRKAIAAVVIAGLTVALAAALRTTNRADAAAGDCYSDTQGPSTPTICN
jgi:hypothetical protein